MERDIKLKLDNILDMMELIKKLCNTPDFKISADPTDDRNRILVFRGIENLAEAVEQEIVTIESIKIADYQARGFIYRGVTVYSLYDEGEEDDHLRGCKEET